VPSFPQSFATILRAEHHHQSHIAPRRRWRTWFNRLLTGVVIVSAIFFPLRAIASLLLGRDSSALYTYERNLEGYLLIFSIAWILVLHFSLIFQTLALSANSISRERQAGTWDLLALTGVDARQIVLGKWWAVIRRLFRPYLTLSVLRTLVILWGTITTYAAFSSNAYSFGLPITGSEIPRIAGVLFSIGFIFLITFLNLGFIAACGLSASPGHSRPSIALARAVGTWLLVVFLSVFIPVVIGFILQRTIILGGGSASIDTLFAAFGFSIITMVDNGLVSSAQLISTYISPFNYQYYSESNYFLQSIGLSIIISVAVYALLTWLMLRYATWSAIRQGALSPTETHLLSGVPGSVKTG
jgi:hypothetical protein